MQRLNSNDLQDQRYSQNYYAQDNYQGVSDDALAAEYAAQQGIKRCNCKKAKCLKLYCVCFSAGVYCAGCACKDCLNTTSHQDIVMSERAKILQRSPRAFAPKVEQKRTGDVTHKKGCRCRKSRCLKKYCECFDAGVHCSSICRCDDCHNKPEAGAMLVPLGSSAPAAGPPFLPPSIPASFINAHRASSAPSTPSHQENKNAPPGSNSAQEAAAAMAAAVAAGELPPDAHSLGLPPGASDTPQVLAMLADLKPTNSLQGEPFMGPASLGLASLPNSLSGSPVEGDALPTGQALASAAAAAIGRPSSRPSSRAGGSAAATPFMLPSNSHALIGQQPMPMLTNSVAGPGQLPCSHVAPHMLLRPEVLVAEPDLAQLLAVKLGMDQTHQMAAQKAAHILKSLIGMARDNPAFVAEAAGMLPPAAQWGTLDGMLHATTSAPLPSSEPMGMAPSLQAMHSAGAPGVSACTPDQGGANPAVIMLPSMCAAKPPPTTTTTTGLPRTSGAMRLGSGSFRFSGAGPASKASDSCRPSESGKPCDSGAQQASVGNANTGFKRQASVPPGQMNGKGYEELQPRPSHSHGHVISHKRAPSQPMPCTSDISAGRRVPHVMAVAADSGPSAKRIRPDTLSEDGTAGLSAQMEVSSGANDKMMVYGSTASPASKATVGRPKRATAGRRNGDLKHGKENTVDTLDSFSEIEAMQALVEMQALPVS